MKHNRERPYNELPPLPPKAELETKEILKKAIEANRILAELKGTCRKLPNPNILVNTIILQESKDSSAIENVVTTQDELYKAVASPELASVPPQTKEVLFYREAIYEGLKEMKAKGGISTNVAVRIMQKLKQTNAAVRRGTGTKLLNPASNKIIYTPPEGEEVIRQKLQAWEQFVNASQHMDPLIVMSLLHYQFEAIHPFADGNGRTGRIINVLYLVNNDLLTEPVLYLSSYIIQHKSAYYRTLREVTEKGKWIDFVLFMLEAVAETTQLTLVKIDEMLKLQQDIYDEIKQLPQRLPARELSEILFSYPYTKIRILEDAGLGHRQTAAKYLQILSEAGIVKPVTVGRDNYYINYRLMDIFSERKILPEN